MNKPLPDDTKVSVARLCTAAEKLLQETERLRRDVAGLGAISLPYIQSRTDLSELVTRSDEHLLSVPF